MATTKITDLTAYTDPVNTDVLPIVDVTSDVTKKVSIANVMKNASQGTAAAPGIAFDGDSNTGIYSPGANQVAITTDGTQRLLIDSAGAVTIAGDLTVNGTTTNINTQNLIVEDKNVVLGDVAVPTDVTADGGGITLKGTTDKTINWVDSTDAWTSSEHINIASGKEYRIAGTKVLDATSLGSSVLITSANITDGTIVNGDINASAAIAGTKISPDFGSQTITTTGVVSAALGAAATPSITFTGDTNTGIYSPGADQVAISTGGSGRLFVDASGRVGIGGASAGDPLLVKAASASMRAETTGDVTSTGTSFVSFADANGQAAYLGYGGDGAGVLSFWNRKNGATIFATNNTERLRITSTGDLNFKGAGTAGSTQAVFFNGSAPVNSLVIDASGRLGAGTSSPSDKLSLEVGAANAGVSVYYSGTEVASLRNDAGNATLNANNAALKFATGGTERLRITSAGLVGIGTSSPSATLSVNSGATALNATFNSTSAVGSQLRFDSSGTAFGYLGTPTGVLGAGSTTGLAIRSEDILAFGTGGANERVRIDTSGRVGINTASPSATLDVLAAASTSVTGFKFASSTSVANNDIFRLQINSLTNGFRMFQDASSNVRYSFEGGNVGIGTTSPSQLLEVAGSVGNIQLASSGAEITFTRNGPSAITASGASGSLLFQTGGTNERARIDSSGRLLVGTSTNRNNYLIQAETTGDTTLSITRNTNDNAGPQIYFSKSRGTTNNSNTAVSNGDTVGIISFNGTNGGGENTAAEIRAVIDGAVSGGGVGDMPGRLVFSTTADGASSPTERMRIHNGGAITMAGGLNVGDSSMANGGSKFILGGSILSSGAGTYPLKWNNSNGNVTYDTSSRLIKEEIVDCPYGIEAIKQLQPRKYFRTDDQREEIGFIADEVVGLMPEFVPVGPKSVITRNEDDTEEIPLGVNYDKLTAVLTKALQEAIAKIETLEAKVAALESA